MERCGKINAVNSGSESWTGIGVVAGCAVVMLITQGPHVQDIATRGERSWHPQTQEAQSRFRNHPRPDAERGEDQQRVDQIWEDVPEDDAAAAATCHHSKAYKVRLDQA